jgi:hypothetical protein
LTSCFSQDEILKATEKIRNDPSRFRGSPVEYIEKYYGTPWGKQIEIVQAAMEPPHRVLVSSGHNVGKTFLLAAMVGYAYECEGPSRVIVTGPSADSVRDGIFMELRKARPNLLGLYPKASGAYRGPGWEIIAKTTNSGERFQGLHGERIYLFYDEAVGIHPIYFEAGASMFTGVPGSGMWVCCYNPTDPSAHVHHLEMTDLWKVIRISQFDHPNIQAELKGLPPPYPSAVRLQQVIDAMDDYGTRLRETDPEYPNQIIITLASGELIRWLPGPLADCRVLGRWPENSSQSIWNNSLWEQVEKTRLDIHPDWRVQIGCDVARYGDDETVIWVKKGPVFLEVIRLKHSNTSEIAERLRLLCHTYKGNQKEREIPVLIDGIGVGGGVVDQAQGYAFIDIQSSARAKEPQKYYNLRAELWFNAIAHAKENLIDISRIAPMDRARLRTELISSKYIVRPDNLLIVEPKHIIKERIKRSPDMADAFNLACYWAYDD